MLDYVRVVNFLIIVSNNMTAVVLLPPLMLRTYGWVGRDLYCQARQHKAWVL